MTSLTSKSGRWINTSFAFSPARPSIIPVPMRPHQIRFISASVFGSFQRAEGHDDSCCCSELYVTILTMEKNTLCRRALLVCSQTVWKCLVKTPWRETQDHTRNHPVAAHQGDVVMWTCTAGQSKIADRYGIYTQHRKNKKDYFGYFEDI